MDKHLDKKTFQTMIKPGSTIMVGGFMTCGTPEILIDWLVEAKIGNLTIICNDAGYENQGVGKLIANNLVARLVASHIGLNPEAGRRMGEGSLTVELVPQGTLAEQIRAYGAGLGGVLTPTGVGTIVETGKDVITIDGVKYLLEKAMGADFALIEAREADPYGNLVYAKTARNFNPIMASAAKTVIARVKDVRAEALDPEVVITPHVLVDYVVEGDEDGR